MKFLSIINYAAVAAAAVIRRGQEEIHISGRDVSATLFNELDFYVEWAEAAYCNAGAANNTPVACAYDNCPQVVENGAIIYTSYTWSANSSDTATDVAMIIGIDHKRQEIVLSYRGTVDIRNWIVNLSFSQSSCEELIEDCEAHQGFLWAWSETKDAVMSGIAAATAEFPSYKIIVTGHSLGGAMATLATAYLRNAFYKLDLYTYGSPRVGNLMFVQLVTNQLGSENRVTKLDDPVPRLPPIFTGYYHTSPEYWIDEGADDSVNTTASEITMCDGYANTNCNGGQLGLSIDAHLTYFQHTGACDEGISSSKRTLSSEKSAQFVTDADIEEQLKTYFQHDIDFINSANNTSNA
ncbi:hypothetical protein TD95_003567 [Thielaviopsis punctulata]|uniref:Fungal lipase-type domain-containing protein n=1 Tax=Thielaviopsis punctulata TaxID=72032 RepID=A0A0F4ZC20_9PEZI|nr:hypothetical protein TD95_003567 [Thielaviopsis punctulata]